MLEGVLMLLVGAMPGITAWGHWRIPNTNLCMVGVTQKNIYLEN